MDGHKGSLAVRQIAATEHLQLRLPLFVACLLGSFGFSAAWLVTGLRSKQLASVLQPQSRHPRACVQLAQTVCAVMRTRTCTAFLAASASSLERFKRAWIVSSPLRSDPALPPLAVCARALRARHVPNVLPAPAEESAGASARAHHRSRQDRRDPPRPGLARYAPQPGTHARVPSARARCGRQAALTPSLPPLPQPVRARARWPAPLLPRRPPAPRPAPHAPGNARRRRAHRSQPALPSHGHGAQSGMPSPLPPLSP